ncbi:MAG: vitamin B12 transporter [Polaribacter sp.]|jgi:vitamin B12 transporter
MKNRSNFSGFIKPVFFLLALSFINSLSAQDAKNEEDNLLVITANRTEQNINDTLAAVEIITREDIERIQPESITDLLTSVAGLDFVHNGGAGQSSSLFTRGTNSDHTLMLIDGVRVGSATLGNKSFSTIPVAQIERIEIVRGPRASLWGSDALGGVIQIFTRRMTAGEYSVEATAGSDEFLSSAIVFGFGSEKISNTVTLSYRDSDGYDVNTGTETDDDGYDRISAAIRGDYTLSDETQLDWVFQYDSGTNEFDSDFGANVNDYKNHLWNIRYSYTVDNWLTQFSLKQNKDYTFSYGNGTDKGAGSVFETRRNQVNILTRYKINDEISVTGGVDHFVDNVERSDVVSFDFGLGQNVSQPFEVTERASDAIYISSIMNFDKIIGEISARYDDVEAVDTNKTFNISAGYKLTDNITVAVSRSKGFKAPSFNDLYYPGFGNDQLVSEESYNREFLIRGHWKSHSALIVNFENKVNKLIAFSFDPVLGFRPFNVDKGNLSGYEFQYKYHHGKLNHKLSATYVNAKDVSVDPFTGIAANEQLLRRAKELYSYELTAVLGDLSLFSQFNYKGRRRDNDFSTFPSTSVYLKSFVQVNLGAAYQVSESLNVKLKVSDFTDAEGATLFTYNAPGRQVFVSFQYRNF